MQTREPYLRRFKQNSGFKQKWELKKTSKKHQGEDNLTNYPRKQEYGSFKETESSTTK